MRLAFQVLGGDGWRFGVAYVSDLLRILRRHAGTPGLELFLVQKGSQPSFPEELREFSDGEIAMRAFPKWSPAWLVDGLARKLLRVDLADCLRLRRSRVDVLVFGSAPRGSGVPTVQFLYDFQHKHMPGMCSESENRERDAAFLRTLRGAERVIVWSEAVRRDCERYYPQHVSKLVKIPPKCHVPPGVFEGDPASTAARYGLPEKFVIVPNQFWRHKNYEAVIEAAKTLNGRGIGAFFVCCGYPGDYRHPRYFSEVLHRLSASGVRGSVAILGLVPREDLFLLMRQSICVLNPSLFEGFGMAAEEARSVGKRSLLSDIPPHREQETGDTMFFDPRSPEALAARIGEMWASRGPGPDLSKEAAAREENEVRERACAAAFMGVVRSVARVPRA